MNGNSESMDTVAVHGGERRPGPDGSVVYPIYQGTVYAVEPGTEYHDLKYIRLELHTVPALPARQARRARGRQAAVATRLAWRR